jgi:DNA-binding PadR family transcriptional regulator
MKKLPTLTHLQFLILDTIGDAQEHYGLEIRTALKEFGEARNSPSFYQSMRRLEDAGWVHGDYKYRRVQGAHNRDEVLRERVYRLTPLGERLHKETLDFYRTRMTICKGAIDPTASDSD